jgi:hypothetical protein
VAAVDNSLVAAVVNSLVAAVVNSLMAAVDHSRDRPAPAVAAALFGPR